MTDRDQPHEIEDDVCPECDGEGFVGFCFESCCVCESGVDCLDVCPACGGEG